MVDSQSDQPVAPLYEGKTHSSVVIFPLIIAFSLIALQIIDHGSLLQYIGIDQFWQLIDPDIPKRSLGLARQLSARALTVVALLFTFRGYMLIGNSKIILTPQSLVISGGLLSTFTETIPLEAINSIEVSQSPAGASGGWGTLTIGTGSKLFQFPCLADPTRAVEAIQSAQRR